ncbi:Uncharacterised protein [Mycobacteroides abscessus subsp. abscessus]|uniref:hypothetical protein n=1 Tax=Mycobacteroides abscessus TaxID=36809 RepID=UPI0009D32DEA|nr:hypothetical protein [Mycobacteroides abscessus]SLL01491.1 Uncharacterised protein [Mycobacteroides abscessus subsp. abscessus]
MTTLVQAVADLLTRQGCGDDGPEDDAALRASVDAITGLARAYTRGRGFTDAGPNADISAVIVTAAARLVSNARQFSYETPIGHGQRAFRGAFTGWSLAEQAALNRYRVRAQ